MAKNKTVPPIDIADFGTDLDDVYKQLSGESTPDQTEAPTEQPKASPPVPASAGDKSVKPAKSSPGKKKGRTKAAPITSPASEAVPSQPAPRSPLTEEDLAWFFSNAADASQPKQLYVRKSTKETLHHVARAAGIPVGHLTDNIVRWFLWANKAEINKLIRRNRNPLDGLDV